MKSQKPPRGHVGDKPSCPAHCPRQWWGGKLPRPQLREPFPSCWPSLRLQPLSQGPSMLRPFLPQDLPGNTNFLLKSLCTGQQRHSQEYPSTHTTSWSTDHIPRELPFSLHGRTQANWWKKFECSLLPLGSDQSGKIGYLNPHRPPTVYRPVTPAFCPEMWYVTSACSHSPWKSGGKQGLTSSFPSLAENTLKREKGFRAE